MKAFAQRYMRNYGAVAGLIDRGRGLGVSLVDGQFQARGRRQLGIAFAQRGQQLRACGFAVQGPVFLALADKLGHAGEVQKINRCAIHRFFLPPCT